MVASGGNTCPYRPRLGAVCSAVPPAHLPLLQSRKPSCSPQGSWTKGPTERGLRELSLGRAPWKASRQAGPCQAGPPFAGMPGCAHPHLSQHTQEKGHRQQCAGLEPCFRPPQPVFRGSAHPTVPPPGRELERPARQTQDTPNLTVEENKEGRWKEKEKAEITLLELLGVNHLVRPSELGMI